jgi:hypothetical protein
VADGADRDISEGIEKKNITNIHNYKTLIHKLSLWKMSFIHA